MKNFQTRSTKSSSAALLFFSALVPCTYKQLLILYRQYLSITAFLQQFIYLHLPEEEQRRDRRETSPSSHTSNVGFVHLFTMQIIIYYRIPEICLQVTNFPKFTDILRRPFFLFFFLKCANSL